MWNISVFTAARNSLNILTHKHFIDSASDRSNSLVFVRAGCRIVKTFIDISSHINKLLEYFGRYFNHSSLARTECLQILNQSNQLHCKLLVHGDLTAYDQHLALAKAVYGRMLTKINSQQLIDDIVFCGNSQLSWEESSRSLSDLYRLDFHSKEIYAFYYLHEINNFLFIDSPLPSRTTVSA